MGNFIRQIRTERGYTTAELAQKVGTSQQQISKLERSSSLKWEWIQRLASALDCHPMDITEGLARPHDDSEREIVKKFHQMAEAQKAAFMHIVDALLAQNKPPKK